MNKKLGLYIHIPFCVKPCDFCPYCKVPYNKEQCDNYIQALIKEIHMVGSQTTSKKDVTSLYFGGGTPTLFPERCFEKILKRIKPYLLDDCEVSTEANPGTVSALQLSNLRQMGINRISLGVQSFNDGSLKVLNRKHFYI